MVQIEKRNHITIVGKGEKIIVMAHGFGCNQTMWRNMLPYFQQYKTVLFDYTGSGASDENLYDAKKYSDLVGYAQDLIDVLHYLDAKNVIYIGHSVSGMIGLLASLQKPDYFERLIMIGASACYLNKDAYIGGFERRDIDELLQLMEMNIAGWASVMAPLVTDKAQFPKVTNNIQNTFTLLNPTVARQFAEVTFFSDNRDKLALCDHPVLLLQCSDDSIVPISAANYLHKHLKNSDMKVIDVKGHYPHISHPQLVSQLILDYIQKEARI